MPVIIYLLLELFVLSAVVLTRFIISRQQREATRADGNCEHWNYCFH
jgi:hypothetical protein